MPLRSLFSASSSSRPGCPRQRVQFFDPSLFAHRDSTADYRLSTDVPNAAVEATLVDMPKDKVHESAQDIRKLRRMSRVSFLHNRGLPWQPDSRSREPS
jgi:hypothetical protein